MQVRKIKYGVFMILLLVVISLVGGSAVFATTTGQTDIKSQYDHFLNSPDVNIYWEMEKNATGFTISGLFQNNYYTDLTFVNLYVDILDSYGKILERKQVFFLNIEPDQLLPFRVTFRGLNSAKKVRFSFDYNYAEWRSSVSNYGILEDTL